MARALVDEWVRSGVTHAVLAPGSRSTPLALALAHNPRIRLDVRLDERSAAFFALGAAKASGRPAVVLSTSGTAAANFLPAAVEALHARVPLVLCTADRPPELRHTGAPQTVDQIKLFGDHVRWGCEVGTPDAGEGAERYWRSVAVRALAEAAGPPAGPVHLNLAFREPLVPSRSETAGTAGSVAAGEAGARGDDQPWTRIGCPARPVPPSDTMDWLARVVAHSERGLIVAGWGAEADPVSVERLARLAGWPVLADPLSGLRRGPLAVSTYDALLRSEAFASAHRPDVVLRFGGPLTSKVATAWLDQRNTQILVDPDRSWLDPHRVASEQIVADPTAVADALVSRLGRSARPDRDSEWLTSWLRAEAAARSALDEALDAWSEPFEGRVARDLVAGLPDGATLVVGSSMPVRDVESYARPRTGVRFLSNRGANGIDGFVSTVQGVAATDPGPVVALCGDLTFLHDAGGLLAAARSGLDAVYVVIDNDGGGIFSFLPQAADGEHFETLFGTPHGVDLAALAAVHGIPAPRVRSVPEAIAAVGEALCAGGVRVIVVPSDRHLNVTRHREAWTTVAAAVTALPS